MAKKSSVNKFAREFISEENRNYKVHIGSTIASSLAGIVCGIILASIVWLVAFNYIAGAIGYICTK
jgi:hypothetical protein